MVVHPVTGEVFELASLDTAELAELRDGVRELRDRIGGWSRALDAELTSRLDFLARRSATAGGWKVAVAAPTEWSTDGEPLRAGLLQLAGEGVLSVEAVDAACPIVPTIAPRRNALKALHRHADERVRALVDAHDREVPNEARRVTVSPTS